MNMASLCYFSAIFVASVFIWYFNSLPTTDLLSKDRGVRNSHAGGRKLDDEHYSILMRLLRLTLDILEENNIEAVMWYRSLAGSYLMHDILPWDDDVDIMINKSSTNQLIDLFSNNSKEAVNMNERGMEFNKGKLYEAHGIACYPHVYKKHIKLFFLESAKVRELPWRWPFINVYFYEFAARNTDIIAIESYHNDVLVPVDAFYPFHKRPFASLWLNAPHSPVLFLKIAFPHFTNACDRWTSVLEGRNIAERNDAARNIAERNVAERNITERNVADRNAAERKATTTVLKACESLAKVYPFVKRSQTAGNRTLEHLMVDGRELYNVTIDATVHNASM